MYQVLEHLPQPGAQKQAPECVIVHSDLDPGGLMSVKFDLISSDSGFRVSGATCDCTYLAVVGLPCAHVIAGANAITGPRVAHVAAASFVRKAHTQRALYEVYGVLGHDSEGPPVRLGYLYARDILLGVPHHIIETMYFGTSDVFC